MAVKGEGENYEKIIAEQLTRIGDILTAAFQGQIIQYNNLVKTNNHVEQLKEAYSKLTMAYNDIKTNNEDLLNLVEQKEKEE